MKAFATILASSVLALVAADAGTSEKLIRDYVDQVWNQQKTDLLPRFVDEDYRRQPALFPRVERAHISTLNEWKEIMDHAFYSFPDMKVQLSDLVIEDDDAFMTVNMQGTQQRSTWGEASGKHFESKCAVHHRIGKSGKLAFTEVFCDFGGLMQHFSPSPVTIDRTHGTTNLENVRGGIETAMSKKIMQLEQMYSEGKVGKEELVQMHDEKFNSTSPSFPKGIDRSMEVDFYQNWNNCMSSSAKGTKAKITMERFYYDEDMSGVTVSWKFTGIHSSKCPEPYQAFTPSGKSLELYGMTYHQFNRDGKLLMKRTVFDNQHVIDVLGGKTKRSW